MAHQKAWTFQEWAKSVGGLENVRKLIGVKIRVVQRWNACASAPSIENMRRLITVSEGRLSYQSIIESTHPLASPAVTPFYEAEQHAQN